MDIDFDDIQMDDIDLDEIKSITAKAKKIQREEEARKRREEQIKRDLELEKAKNEAMAVIQTIPYKMKQAALDGKNSVSIVELKWEDFKRESSFSWNKKEQEPSERLNTKAKLIWDFLDKKGLNPTLCTAHDGYGEKSWDYINANW